MVRTIRGYAAAALGLLLGMTACHNDELFRPANLTLADPLFTSYVSMGTSITAGFQSDGINDSTQLQSYAVLLAQQMGTPFFAPLMNRPGCPPPLTNIYAQTRVPPTVPNDCALRKAQAVPPPYISNVAVPGAKVVDALDNLDATGNPNALTTFFLGGLTQFEMLRRARPTFVTVELGANEVLGAATDDVDAGNTAKITPVATFEAQYGELLDSLEAANPQGVVLVGVPNVALVPFFSRGSYFHTIANRGPTDVTPDTFPPNFLVNPNCAAAAGGDFVLIPFPAGAARVAFAKANPGVLVGVDCADDVNILAAELTALTDAVNGYNAFIADEATSRGWVYLDPNALLAALPPGTIPQFPNTPPRATSVTIPFGPFFSLDGIHPSAVAHKAVANALIPVINVAYGTSLQAIP